MVPGTHCHEDETCDGREPEHQDKPFRARLRHRHTITTLRTRDSCTRGCKPSPSELASAAIVTNTRTTALNRIGSLAGTLDLAALPPFLYGLLTVAWIASSSGGYFQTTWSWAALTTLLLALLTLVLRARVAFGRLDLVLVGGLVAFSGWTAASALWTPSVPSTLDEVTRCLAYLGVVSAGLLLVERRTAGSLLAGVYAGIALVSLYALGTRVLPDRLGTFNPYSTGYQLSTPIGYFNGLGIFVVMGTLLGLGFAARARTLAGRALAAAPVPLLAATLYFAFSRGSWFGLAAGLIAALLLDRSRLQFVTAGILLAAPTAAAVVLASDERALRVEGSTLTAATAAGHRLVGTRRTRSLRAHWRSSTAPMEHLRYTCRGFKTIARSRMSYQKTTVEIDVDELEQAQRTLRTRGIKETVNTALREVNRKAALEAAAAYVLTGEIHTPDEETWAGWREPRGS